MYLTLPLLFILLFSFSTEAARKKTKLTPFEKNIENCLQDGVDITGLTNLQKIYEAVSKKYLLISSVVLGREVLFKVKDESRKLTYQDGKLRLFKILTEEDDRAVPIDNEVRQKSLTVESYLSQLLIHADIRSDWMKTRETHSESTFVDITMADGEIKSLLIEREKIKKKLECNHTATSDNCSCTDIK